MSTLASGGPASSRQTLTPWSSLRRAARTQPAEPAPMITQSYMLLFLEVARPRAHAADRPFWPLARARASAGADHGGAGAAASCHVRFSLLRRRGCSATDAWL